MLNFWNLPASECATINVYGPDDTVYGQSPIYVPLSVVEKTSFLNHPAPPANGVSITSAASPKAFIITADKPEFVHLAIHWLWTNNLKTTIEAFYDDPLRFWWPKKGRAADLWFFAESLAFFELQDAIIEGIVEHMPEWESTGGLSPKSLKYIRRCSQKSISRDEDTFFRFALLFTAVRETDPKLIHRDGYAPFDRYIRDGDCEIVKSLLAEAGRLARWRAKDAFGRWTWNLHAEMKAMQHEYWVFSPRDEDCQRYNEFDEAP